MYFARDSSYSAHPTYSHPDENGIQRMFAVRLAIGEVCIGHKDQLVPDVRIPETMQLYDTTTNDKDKPILWVVYHDAQAYPEYLVEFKNSSIVKLKDVVAGTT